MMDTEERHRMKGRLHYAPSLVEADAGRRCRLLALMALQDPPAPLLADRLLWGAVVLVVGGLAGWAFCQRPVLDALAPLLGLAS